MTEIAHVSLVVLLVSACWSPTGQLITGGVVLYSTNTQQQSIRWPIPMLHAVVESKFQSAWKPDPILTA